jgi:hypothetical protein
VDLDRETPVVVVFSEIHLRGIMKFASVLVVSLLVLGVLELTVQVAQMPLKVLASVAFGAK